MTEEKAVRMLAFIADIENIPFYGPATYELFQRADTDGYL
jgi:hypothetical protein